MSFATTIWAPDMRQVAWPRAGETRTRAQIRYAGYQLIDQEVGVGQFYPDEFIVSRCWLIDDHGTHVMRYRTVPGAVEYIEVQWDPRPREWRDGQWRARMESA